MVDAGNVTCIVNLKAHISSGKGLLNRKCFESIVLDR